MVDLSEKSRKLKPAGWNAVKKNSPKGEKMKFEGEKPSINFKYKSKSMVL